MLNDQQMLWDVYKGYLFKQSDVIKALKKYDQTVIEKFFVLFGFYPTYNALKVKTFLKCFPNRGRFSQ